MKRHNTPAKRLGRLGRNRSSRAVGVKVLVYLTTLRASQIKLEPVEMTD
jgi:hypothetical protein